MGLCLVYMNYKIVKFMLEVMALYCNSRGFMCIAMIGFYRDFIREDKHEK